MTDSDQIPLFQVSSQPRSKSPVSRRKKPHSKDALIRRLRELPDDELKTEADIVRALKGHTVLLSDLYRIADDLGISSYAHGLDRVQDGQTRSQRRVRNALQHAKASGRAVRLEPATWVLDDSTLTHRNFTLVIMGEPSTISLMVGAAAEVLREIDEPIDLIICDPPYGLGVNQGFPDRGALMNYARDASRVIDGYKDVQRGRSYADFSAEWIGAASEVLRPGGQLAVITGPQQAAYVQVAAEQSGLGYVNSISVDKVFPQFTRSRLSHAHWTVTLMCSGSIADPSRNFFPIDDLPKAESGNDYMLDRWHDIPKYERPQKMKNANALHPLLIDRLVRMTTRETDLVVDPMGGSMQTAAVCLLRNRRCISSDLNPRAVNFGMARLIDLIENRQFLSASQAEMGFEL